MVYLEYKRHQLKNYFACIQGVNGHLQEKGTKQPHTIQERVKS